VQTNYRNAVIGLIDTCWHVAQMSQLAVETDNNAFPRFRQGAVVCVRQSADDMCMRPIIRLTNVIRQLKGRFTHFRHVPHDCVRVFVDIQSKFSAPALQRAATSNSSFFYRMMAFGSPRASEVSQPTLEINRPHYCARVLFEGRFIVRRRRMTARSPILARDVARPWSTVFGLRTSAYDALLAVQAAATWPPTCTMKFRGRIIAVHFAVVSLEQNDLHAFGRTKLNTSSSRIPCTTYESP
jgi:hypothetical protein